MRRVFAVLSVIAVLASAPPTLACQSAGPNTHIGVVTAIDPTAGTFALRDAESQMDLTFRATAEQLRTLAVGDQVAVTYAQEGPALRARTIRKS